MQVYKEMVAGFLPTPTKSHYVFNLRDFSRVIRGILLVPAARMTESDKLIRLWVHETYRVFYDRLIEDADRWASLKVHIAVFSGGKTYLKFIGPYLRSLPFKTSFYFRIPISDTTLFFPPSFFVAKWVLLKCKDK